MTLSGMVTVEETVVLDADRVSHVPVDLSSLPAEKLNELNVCVAEWRSAGRRLIRELFTMTQQLATMQEILQDQFYSYVDRELGVQRKTAYRYLHINKVLISHFTNDGQLTLTDSQNITQRALMLLSPTTDSAVMDEVKTALTAGQTVDVPYLQEVISRHEAEHATRLASAQAEAQAAVKALERRLEQTELQLARSQRDADSQAEMLRRNKETAQLLEQENRELRSAATEVRYEEKQVEVIPPGFKSVAEAIEAKELQLSELAQAEQRLKQGVEELNAQRSNAQQELDSLVASTANFRSLQAQLETLIGRYPMDTLVALANRERSIKAAYQALGQTMSLFGEQLIRAGD